MQKDYRDSGDAGRTMCCTTGMSHFAAGNADRLTSLSDLIADTDATLRRGVPAGSAALGALTSYGNRLSSHESSVATTTLDEIQRISYALAEEHGQPPMVVIDYLQKVPLDAGYDDTQRIAAVTERLKDMALDLGAPVVAIAAADREILGAGRRMRARPARAKDFEHGRYDPDGRAVHERLIDERVVTS
ncbi:DnaB-like helicase C-terminal domain-containing protein [Flexivirga alba]|uniref:DnaB-like helicase C-terminal domain-containing protein n=1 Tax=Flexivirga alba TaxID=702742 RepID=A0ABW2ACP2_9MICO